MHTSSLQEEGRQGEEQGTCRVAKVGAAVRHVQVDGASVVRKAEGVVEGGDELVQGCVGHGLSPVRQPARAAGHIAMLCKPLPSSGYSSSALVSFESAMSFHRLQQPSRHDCRLCAVEGMLV